MSTQSDRWSARLGHARVPIALFKDLQFIRVPSSLCALGSAPPRWTKQESGLVKVKDPQQQRIRS